MLVFQQYLILLLRSLMEFLLGDNYCSAGAKTNEKFTV